MIRTLYVDVVDPFFHTFHTTCFTLCHFGSRDKYKAIKDDIQEMPLILQNRCCPLICVLIKIKIFNTISILDR